MIFKDTIYQIVVFINRNIRRYQILPSTNNINTTREAEPVNRRIPRNFVIPVAAAGAAD